MAKPIIKSFSPPDATKSFNIPFYWSGERAYKNRLIIYNNTTNAVVYNQEVTSFNSYHTVPANRLSNGGTWIAQISVSYQDPSDPTKYISSEVSDKKIFHTLATPNFSFYGLNQNEINEIDSSVYQASINYHSSDNEKIESYIFYLYDSTKKLLYETDRFTDAVNINYSYRGLDNLTSYYIQCRGVTRNGVELDTGLFRIYVRYYNPSAYSRIFATSKSERGTIEVASNIIIIEYKGNDTFTFDDSWIDLGDKRLYYNDRVFINNDFSLIVKMKEVQHGELIRLSNGTDTVTVCLNMHPDGLSRFKLVATNGVYNYILYSDGFKYHPDQIILLGIRRIDEYYELETNIDNSMVIFDYWIGQNTPSTPKRYDVWLVTNDSSTIYKSYEDMKIVVGGNEPSGVTKNDIWISSSDQRG